MPAPIYLRRGIGPPPALAEGEPVLDMTPGAAKLYAGVAGAPVLIADHAYVLALAARVAQLEASLRELQFKAWTGVPLAPGTIIPP
jgi:hypothetical protein